MTLALRVDVTQVGADPFAARSGRAESAVVL